MLNVFKAVNKLAEIMNRKDFAVASRGQRGKVSESEMRKKEKERRKLEQELKQVWICPYVLLSHFTCTWLLKQILILLISLYYLLDCMMLRL